MRHYINQECKFKDFSTAESDFYFILKSAITMEPSKSISELYGAISAAKNDNTLHIKVRWEREAGIEISEEVWGGDLGVPVHLDQF